MKTEKYQRRLYRDWVKAKDLRHTRIIARETDLRILADKLLDKEFVIEKIRLYRWDIENYIMKDRRFLISLVPISIEASAPRIVQAMNEAALKANAGPMAAVAGALVQFLGNDLLKLGLKEVILQNGGDIFLKTRKIRKVSIYSGNSKRLKNLALEIRPKDTPLGICTSSGTVGHSLSLGCADSVVILARSAALADASATAVGNLVQSKKDLERALQFAQRIPGVSGAVIISKDSLVSWGKVEFVR